MVIKEKFNSFFKRNVIVFVYLVLFAILEVYSLNLLDCYPVFFEPIYPLLFITMVVSLLFMFDNKYVKIFVPAVLLFFQGVLSVALIFLYDANGTCFEWEMINQRDDALSTVQDLEFNIPFIVVFLVIFVFFCFTSLFYSQFIYKKIEKTEKYSIKNKTLLSVVFAISTICVAFVPSIDGFIQTRQSYVKRYLYGSSGSVYQNKGVLSNCVYEFFNGTIASELMKYDTDGVDDFIYDGGLLEKSDYHGISKGNNLVYILVESFEWYTFLDLVTEEQSRELYPNLNRFIDEGLIADNFYSREKTDTAEVLALLGSNPTNKYVNYGFENNSYPYSLPNLFKKGVGDSGNSVKQVKSFHQNLGDFYNRKLLHKSVGFDEYVSIEDMVQYGIETTEYTENGDRTLDSLTINAMKEEMFPKTVASEQYMTFYISLVMHGNYVYRENLDNEGYYDKLDAVGAFPESDSDEDANYLRTYAASVMDFDRALGIMFDRLQENNQLDKTTIVMFADHNTYYNNLSNYAKNINERYNSELYRVPFMLYDTKLTERYEEDTGTRKISKFTCGQDILPTVLDIFGIDGYKNLYFGTSMFVEDVESVIYSRAYAVFVTDKLMCRSSKRLLYTGENYSWEYMQDFINRATIHLKKLEYIDKIYNNDYFKTNQYVYPS